MCWEHLELLEEQSGYNWYLFILQGECLMWNLIKTSNDLGEDWNQAGYGQQLSGDLPRGWNWRNSGFSEFF